MKARRHGRALTAHGRAALHAAGCAAAGSTWAAPRLQRSAYRLGKAVRPATWVGDQLVRPVRQADDEAVQDNCGHLSIGRRSDPGRAGRLTDRLAGLFLHRSVGERVADLLGTGADPMRFEIPDSGG